MKRVMVGVVGLVMLLGYSIPVFATNIDNLAGTLSCLKDQPKEIQELSVLHGAVAWHKGVIRRLYDLGPCREEPRINPAIKEAVEKAKKDVFAAQAAEDKEKEEKLVKAKKELADAELALNPEKEKVKTWFNSLSPSIKLVRTLFHRAPGTTSVADFKLSERVDGKFKEPKEFAKAIAEIIISVHKNHQNPQAKIKKLARENENILKAQEIKDALEDTTCPGYDVVRLALLAALWVKCGNDRDALDAYYGVLGKNLQKQKFEGQTEKIKEGVESYNIESLKDLSNYESFVYVNLLPSSQPDDASYSKATLTIDGQKKFNFPDCMDTVIRNFINHLSYDPAKQEFSVELLKKLTEKDPHQKLVKFYNNHKDAKEASSQAAHDDWSDVVSNIPFVEYKQTSAEGFVNNQANHIGFIFLPGSIEEKTSGSLIKFLSDKRYVVCDKKDDSFFYEVRSNCRNLIIILNHVLNFGLFGNNEENLAAEFVRPDFVKTYLPKIFEKFFLDENDFEILGGKKLDTIDEEDFGSGTISFKFPLNSLEKFKRTVYPITFDLSIRCHGEFWAEKLPSAVSGVVNNLSIDHLMVLAMPTTEFLLPENKLCAIVKDVKEKSKIDWYLPLFAQEIDNPSRAEEIARTLVTSSEMVKFFLFLVARHSDQNQVKKATYKVYCFAYENFSSSVSWEILLKDKSTSLSRAINHGCAKLVDALIKHGANLSSKGSSTPPLHLAASKNSAEVVKVLIKAGADKEAGDYSGMRPLHRTANGCCPEVVKAFLDAGAEIEAEDNRKWTPLYFAASLNNVEVVKVLLDAGANANAKNNEDKTPLDIAKEMGFGDIIELLQPLSLLRIAFQRLSKKLDEFKTKLVALA